MLTHGWLRELAFVISSTIISANVADMLINQLRRVEMNELFWPAGARIHAGLYWSTIVMLLGWML